MPLGRSACAADQENPLQRSVPEEIWRGTSYYLVERSQHDVEARAEENCCGSGSFMLDGMKEERRRALGGKSTLGRRRIEKKIVD